MEGTTYIGSKREKKHLSPAGCSKSMCTLDSNEEAQTSPGCWSYLEKDKNNLLSDNSPVRQYNDK